MRHLVIPFVAALALAACSKPAPTDTVESLMADPPRLKDLRAQCKADRAKVGEATCNTVGETTRRQFLGTGTPYTPPASPPPAFSAPKN
jgi:hypothetical protein